VERLTKKIRENHSVEKYTFRKFHHAEKEMNAMHWWVKVATPDFNRWWSEGNTTSPVINCLEKGKGQE